jgi:23S rRNA pseudouridine2605 synthase
MSERLQKFLARAGVASRRHAEELITAGRVQVNNQRVTELGSKVEPTDLVTLDGSLVTAPETTSWYLLNKPPGVVTTLSDPEGRPTVAALLREVPTRVFPVGRLDWDAEGALLFTNDGAAAHRLLHPSFEVRRTYLVKVKGAPTEETLQRLCQGVRLEDGPARALRAERFEAAERNTWLVLEVGEGRPHLVKRLCAAIGHPVLRLFRPAHCGISVAGMGAGQVRPLSPEEVARVQSVAAGTPVPEPTLFLPPRRHGRAGDMEEAGGEDEARTGLAPRAAQSGAARHSGDRLRSPQRHGRAARAGSDFKRRELRPNERAVAIAGTQVGPQRGAPRHRQAFRGGGSTAPAGRSFGAPRDRQAVRSGGRIPSAPGREASFERATEGGRPQRFGRADRAGGAGDRAPRPFGPPRGRGSGPPRKGRFGRAPQGPQNERRFERGAERGRAGQGPRGPGPGRDRRDVEHQFGAPGDRPRASPGQRGAERDRWRGGAPAPEPFKRDDRGSGDTRRAAGSRHRLGAPGAVSDISAGRGGFARPPQPGARRGGRFGARPRHTSNRPNDRGRKPPGRPPPAGGRGGTRPGSGRRSPPRR